MPNTITDPRYAISYVGNPRGKEATFKTLGFGGPLVLPSQHLVASVLPGVMIDDQEAGKVSTKLTIMQRLLCQGTNLDNQGPLGR